MTEPELLRIPDAARLLNRSDRTIYDYIKRGLLSVVITPSGKRRIRRDELLAFREAETGQRRGA